MIEVGACLAFTFGLMGYCGVPVYLTIAVMPVLLTAMAVTDEIHIYSRYFALVNERPDASQAELVRLTMEKNLTVLGTLGNNAPFVGLLGTVIGIVRAFRIFTAIGLLFCLLWTICVLLRCYDGAEGWVIKRGAKERGPTASAANDPTASKSLNDGSIWSLLLPCAGAGGSSAPSVASLTPLPAPARHSRQLD
jgi:predicted RND superfamily exporter protein